MGYKTVPIRSALFNTVMFVFNLLACCVFFPALLLPRRAYLRFIGFYLRCVYMLERGILNLDFEIRGRENVPESGPCLIAAKHFSAYETFKLHLLFNDPAIILKRELLRIPLWGYYLKKSRPIAINRTSPKTAISSMTEGALKIKEQGRPLVIFPQGTRVRVDQTPADKPYKSGIARIQAATELPVIPMATNSGYFCPRGRWLKRSGTVVFEFLAPIPPGKETKALMAELEEKLENASNALIEEAMNKTS